MEKKPILNDSYNPHVFEAILNTHIVSITDVKGNIKYVNKQFETISGYSAHELLGKNHSIINSQFHNKTLWQGMWRTISSGKVWSGEIRNKRKDGEFYWVRTNIIPIRNEEDKIIEYISIRTDITEAKVDELRLIKENSLLESQVIQNETDLDNHLTEYVRLNKLFNEVQNQGKIGVWEVDLNTYDTYWSEEVYNIHELPEEEKTSVEKGINFYHPEHRPIIQNAVEEGISRKKPWDLELKIVSYKGNEKWVRAIGLPVVEKGKVIGLRGLFQEIDQRKKAELELQRTNKILEVAIEAGEIGVWNWDMKTSHLSWNQNMHSIFGVPISEFKNNYEDFRSAIHPEDIEKVETALNKSIATGEKFELEYRTQWKSGEIRYIHARGLLSYSTKGLPSEMIGVCLDITKEVTSLKELAKRETILNRTIKNSPSAIAILTKENKFFSVNIAFERITGYSLTDLKNQTINDLITPESLEVYKEAARQVEKEDESHFELELYLKTKNGKIFCAEYHETKTFNTDKESSFVMIQFQDITERKEIEHEKARIQKQMELEVESRTAELNESNKELESFNYSVSHDLRAPLRSIHGFANIIKEEYSSHFDSEGKKYIDAVLRNSTKMGNLIDDLLSFSRMGKKAITSESIDMDSIVNEIIRNLSFEEKLKGTDIRIHKLPNAEADRNMIQQVWINLISNAIKFSSTKELAIIEISGEEKGDFIEYRISDNGVGFNMKYADKLFGVFQRLHKDTEFPGTGIGLAFIKRIIKKHGGNIWAISKPNEGAVFYFTLKKGNHE